MSFHAPLLLILEDVHPAGSGTLFLLLHLARHMRHRRVMIVATHRDLGPEEAPALHEMLLDLSRERLGTRLRLPRLDRERTEQLLGILFAEEITPEFLEGIYGETEGNPFFIEEVCKALVDSGKLSYRDGRWLGPSMVELGIPNSIRVAIRSRVGVLPEQAQDALRWAAVLGRQFNRETLAAASDEEGWYADYPGPDDVLRVPWWLRFGGWRNDASVRPVDSAQRVLDQAAPVRMYQQADGMLVEETPLVPLSYGRFHMLMKPWVKKLSPRS